jgi:hypothetical protein
MSVVVLGLLLALASASDVYYTTPDEIDQQVGCLL